MDCSNLSLENINLIFEKLLYEFPVQCVNIKYPTWIDALDSSHWLKQDIFNEVKNTFKDIRIIKQIISVVSEFHANDIITSAKIDEINLGQGIINISLTINSNLFYKILTEISGSTINDQFQLFSTFYKFANIKKKYDRIAPALEEVNAKGYGIITPGIDDLILDEPEMVKQGTRYGVKLKAKAPSIHLIKTNVETEISPIVGSEKQSEDLVKYLLSQFESDPKKIWESNIFGRSLHELVNEGLQNKLSCMPEEAQMKLQQTLEKIVNEGSGGLICIIL